jgi:hypothetical protein
MRRGRHGESLADRAARSAANPAAPESAAESTAAHEVPVEPARVGRPAGDGHGRHCWVRDPPQEPGIWPGLLVEWRQREDGWHERVAYTVTGSAGPVLVEAWLPAEQLKPD